MIYRGTLKLARGHATSLWLHVRNGRTWEIVCAGDPICVGRDLPYKAFRQFMACEKAKKTTFYYHDYK